MTVALTESNLNDNTPVFGAGSYSFTYAENQSAGAVLGTVAASDLDVSDTVSYSITGGDPNGWFQIDSAGEISLTALGATTLANDFEALANTRNLTVQASDGSNTSTVTVALTESNLNDNTPVFGAGSYSFTYAENQTRGCGAGDGGGERPGRQRHGQLQHHRRRPQRLVPDQQCGRDQPDGAGRDDAGQRL